MIKPLTLFFLACLIAACDRRVDQTEPSNLFSNIKPSLTKADSIEVGKDLKLSSIHFDTAFLAQKFKFKSTSKYVPLATTNIDSFKSNDTIDGYVKSEDFELKPTILKAKPFISFAEHPKPMRSGELRSTGLSNSDISYLSEEQGLPSSQVRCLVEDPNGYFWIGQNAGLTKYDGYNFYTYTTKNGLPTNGINKIIINADSSLWLATNNGLVHFDGTIFKIYNKECGLPGNLISDIALDRNGDVWCICQEAGLVKLKNDELKIYGEGSGLRTEPAYKLAVDNEGRIVVGNWGGSPTFIKNEIKATRFTNEFPQNKYGKKYETCWRFGSDVTTSLYTDKKGRLWIGSYSGGAALYLPNNTIRYKPSTGMPYFLISTLMEDSKGNMWVGSGEGGIAKMDSKGFVCYTSKQGLTSNKIMCVLEDSQKNIWIGTQDGGLNRIKPNSFRNYSSIDGLSDKGVISFCETKKGEVLIGTWGGGFYAFNGKRFLHFSESAIILALKENSRGQLISSIHQFGISLLTPSKIDTVLYDSSYYLSRMKNFDLGFAYSIYVDKNDDVWLANIDKCGLTRYSYNSFDKYLQAQGLATGKTNIVTGDKKGNIWIANPGAGISKIHGNTIKHFTKANGLSSNDVVSLYVDKQDNIWIGTTNGICKYNGSTFNYIDAKDGLSSNNVTSIIEDNQGRMWVATSRGLNLLTPSSKEPKGYLFERFLLNDGLKINAFHPNAVLLDQHNVLWWGTSKGALTLDLNEFNIDKRSPDCHIQQIGLMDQYLNFVALKDSIEKQKKYYTNDSSKTFNKVNFTGVSAFANLPLDLSLPYNLNTVNFNFYAFSGLSPYQTKYRYRLLGENSNWTSATYPEAKFSNLDAGQYTFEAQAKLEGEDWGKLCSYSFEVRPPFWKTWWFRLLGVGLIVYSVVLIFRFRNKQLLERQEQLETTVKERTSEIEHQKHLIEEKQKEIVDSINYAKRIQYALLAHEDVLKQNLNDYFIYFNPKDIVSGDFYWSTKKDDRFYLAVCDSTGHGVPGAFMSLLNIGFLTEAIVEKGIEKPNEIFNYVRQKLIDNISKEGQKDGFDGILICIDRKNKKLTYSSANNSPIIVSNNTIIGKESDRMPVGVGVRQESFKLFELDTKGNDILYLYTDGFADQFGGPKGKKFKYGQLNQLLLDISQKQLSVQKEILQDAFNSWKGALEQVDDVCVIGIRI